MSNPFADGPGVATYDQARPYFHPRITRRLAELLPEPVRRLALDVGCGTGQSTLALASIAHEDRVGARD